MTLREIQEALQALQAELGPRADVSASINNRGTPLYIALYPEGICGRGVRVRAEAETWDELFVNAREAWGREHQKHHEAMVSKMALEIIRITDEQGECSDSALRGDTYLQEDIERYGDAACAKANEMAGKGPFEIVKIRGANAA